MTAIHTDTYPNSYYFSSLNYQTAYPRLEESINADICIVGGGFSGVATAVELAERGLKLYYLSSIK